LFSIACTMGCKRLATEQGWSGIIWLRNRFRKNGYSLNMLGIRLKLEKYPGPKKKIYSFFVRVKLSKIDTARARGALQASAKDNSSGGYGSSGASIWRMRSGVGSCWEILRYGISTFTWIRYPA